MKKLVLLFVLCALLVIGCHRVRPLPSISAPDTPQSAVTQAEPRLDKQRGISWTAGRQIITPDNLAVLKDNNVNWIVQTPFGWQRDIDSPDLFLKTTGVYWGETDEGLTLTTQYAQDIGIQTLLKPHIWLTQAKEGKWRTDIKMRSEADWQTWFKNYRTFILHYAKFAEQQKIPMLCIGTELQTTAIQREQDWRTLIADIRQVYSGQLTYAANWFEAFEQIQFWDALDFIGIQAYFPLSTQNEPTVEQLKAGWQPHLDNIAVIQKRYQKPVIFTEIGYRSTEDAAIEPWKWPDSSELNPSQFATEAGLQTQANCYEAFFQTVWDQDWFAGAYWWKWFPAIEPGSQQSVGQGFTPQNKPAEQILRSQYGTASKTG
ncbi:MAG: glycoside hydrolase TIM-barrel-like domain-containing protein [Thermosynechococcaceae cyanobacterium]